MEENTVQHTFDIAALRLKIARGQTPAVLAELAARSTEIEPTSLRNDFFLLNNRWAQLERDRHQGALTPDEVNKQRVLINQSLLAWLDRLEAGPDAAAGPAVAKKIPWRTVLAALAGIIAVLAGLAEISGYSVRDWWERPAPATELSAFPVDKEEPAADSAGEEPAEQQNEAPVPPESPAPRTAEPPPTTTRSEVLPPPREQLAVAVKTNKGSENLVFSATEEVRLYVRVNRACRLRTIYRLADGSLVLLDDDRSVTTAEAGRWIELGAGFEVAAPFGTEELYVFAQEAAFAELVTRYEDGYDFIEEGLPAALSKTRGLKKKPAFAETKLAITTVAE